MIRDVLDIRHFRRFSLVCLLGLFMTACGMERPPLITIYTKDKNNKTEPAPPSKPKSSVLVSPSGKHRIGKGETLYSVSRAYGTDIQAIVKANKLKPPYKLKPGQVLIIPKTYSYVVKKGDSIWGISEDHSISVSELVRANDLPKPYTIFVGQRLVLPGGDRAPKLVSNQSGKTVGTVAPRAKPAAKVTQTGKGWPRPTLKPSEPVQVAKIKSIAQPIPRANSKFLMPVRGRVISSYGPKAKGLHNDGINIAAPRGTSVKAAENGTVAYTGSQKGGFGNLILVRHSDGFISAYAHTGDMLVKRGDKVRRGQVIGKVGSTGNVDRPQLHFQIRKGRKTLDPMKFIS